MLFCLLLLAAGRLPMLSSSNSCFTAALDTVMNVEHRVGPKTVPDTSNSEQVPKHTTQSLATVVAVVVG